MKPICKKIIVVEGKYDKIRIESCLEATVFTTEGFHIFKDREKRAMLRALSEKVGIVVLADPDGAGKLIRSHLHTVCHKEGITDLYIPPIPGREKRKKVPSKEGYLGVEGVDNETLIALFDKSGLLSENTEKKAGYTKTDLYRMGYFGKEDSKGKRQKILRENHLPENLSANAFLDVVNLMEIEL